MISTNRIAQCAEMKTDQETRRVAKWDRRTCKEAIPGRATTPVGAASSACPDASGPAYLFVSDGGARRAGKMDDFEALKSDFAAPSFEIRGGVIERVAEFDQHV